MVEFLTGLIVILLIISIVGIAVTLRYRSEMRAIREHINSLDSNIIKTSCGSIEYAQAGNGYPVLAVHGNAGGFDQGLMLANRTIDSKFQIISISRFGYLRSPMPANSSVKMQADAFACLLDSLDIEQAAVVAYSAGSTSAIQFAMRHPERVSALIFVSPAAPGKGPIMPKPIFNIFFRNDFVYWATITYFWSWVQQAWAGVPKGFTPTHEEKAEVRALLFNLLPVSARVNGSLFDIYISSPEIFNSFENKDYLFSNIKTPTLVISAVDDPLALHENARTLMDLIPNASFTTLPDGGHMLLGQDEKIKSEITRFLRSNVRAE